MKKLFTLFMCLALVGLSSCSDDDENGDGSSTGVTLKARVQYSTDANGVDTKPDAGAKVYLFFDFDHKNPNGYIYQVGGKYVKDGVTINAEQTATIDSDGNATINAKYTNRPLTVVVDSKHFSGRYSEYFYSNFKVNEIYAIIFKPE